MAGVLCLTLLGCDHAEAKSAKCASLTLVSSGNEPELEWFSGILKSYLATYLFELGEMKPGIDCTLETRFEGNLDQDKGYMHRSRIVQAGRVIWSYEHTSRGSGTFIHNFQEAFDIVAALEKAGVINIPNGELLEPGDPQISVEKLCARETVEPIHHDPRHVADTVLILGSLDRIDEDPCGLFCQAFVSEWRGNLIQVRASIDRKYLWAILEGRKKGTATAQNNWTHTSPAITTPGYYERLVAANTKDFRPIPAPGRYTLIKKEDAYRYAGGVVHETRILKSEAGKESLVGLHLWLRMFPDRRVPSAFRDVLTVSKQCSKGITGSGNTFSATVLARAVNGRVKSD
jgi:hypothetical protein